MVLGHIKFETLGSIFFQIFQQVLIFEPENFKITWKISSAYLVNEVNHKNTKSLPCKYHVTHVKRKNKIKIWVKFIIYLVLSQFQTCRNLGFSPAKS